MKLRHVGTVALTLTLALAACDLQPASGPSGDEDTSSGGTSSGGTSSGGTSSGGTSSGGTSSGGTSSGGNTGDARPSAGCGKPRTLQNGMNSVQSNGTRSYILRVPDGYDPTHPYRLVVAYHWLGGSAPEVANGNSWASERPFYGLWELAAGSTIFVAPVGLVDSMGPGWANVNGQDVAFTDAMLARLEADLCIDRSRIFATGFSYGAGMSYAIACARPDVFRGVALYSGALISGCAGGAGPIAFFASHGLGDGVLPFGRGQELRDHFVAVNGCTNAAPQDATAGSGSHRCTTYQGCSQGHPVTWCSFDGDHNPNPHDRGATTSWNPAEVWRFLSQL